MDQWGDTLTSGPLVLDQAARQVRYDGSPVHLTRTEFEILSTLMDSPRRVFTRQQLVDRVWGTGWTHMDHSVNVHVSNLRRKIHDRAPQPPIITTLRGVGYRFDAAVVRNGEPDLPSHAMSSPSVDATAVERPSEGVDTLTLVFDADCVLVEVLPPIPKGLEGLTERVGEFLNPAPGVDQDTARLLLRTLVAAGMQEISGMTEVTLADGSRVRARSHMILSSEAEGLVPGYVMQLSVPARVGA